MQGIPIEMGNTQLRPYWIAHLSDGRTVTEKNMEWDDLPAGKITSLQLQLPTGKKVTISKRGEYRFFQMKQGLQGPGVNVLEGVIIGAVVDEIGNCFYIFVHINGNIMCDTDNIKNPKKPYFVPLQLNEEILK